MKRKIYQVSGAVSYTKSTWNTARRGIQAALKGVIEKGQILRLTSETLVKNEYKEYISGEQIWNDQKGKEYKVKIKLLS